MQDPIERFTDWTPENLHFYDKKETEKKTSKGKKQEEKKPPRKK